jgi:maltose alpha-D-glucosyltransferase/alpha-amylase
MRSNLGIRRRLAPLLEHDRRRTELFTALLLSLPGSPVLYYGDEIGMGDNVALRDRDSVRTPMQWSACPNGGFSPAEPERMHVPVNADPRHGYRARNVEAQQHDASSLLRWNQRMIGIRRDNPVFSRGDFSELGSDNPAVLSFLRKLDGDTVLCVNNLSSAPQSVDLDLGRWRGCHVIELVGGSTLPDIGPGPYRLPLGPHGFCWLRLRR